MLKINGQSLDLEGVTLGDYLAENGFDPRRIAVEINGAIVPKSAYGDTVLAEGDAIEIVSFVGGG